MTMVCHGRPTLKSASLATLVIILVSQLPVLIANNVCYVEEGGCRYRVTILPTSVCSSVSGSVYGGHSNDQPVDGNVSSGGVDKLKTDPATLLGLDSLAVDPVKKLENLESKLIKMVEELSVRSLRHIREIRSDLRQMTVSVNSLKSPSGSVRAASTRGGATGGSVGEMLTGHQVAHVGRSGGGVGTRCPLEFVGVGTWRSCYRFSNFEASWHEAREYCSAFGANLVSIDTMKEAYIVDYLIKSNPEHQEPKGWWTSGSYVVRSQRWMWTETNQLRPIGAFSRWAPGEPNARSTMHCLILYKLAKYQWHDATCTDKHTFICEME